MNKLLALLSLCILFSGAALGQESRICGTAGEHAAQLERLLIENKARLARQPVLPRSTQYVPVKFHLIARNDGSGRVEERLVLDDLCLLNEIFSEMDVQFYSKDGFNYIDNSAAFSDPVSTLNSILAFNKDANAMNVFIVGNADTGTNGEGVTLGFYSPSFDLVVINKSELGRSSKALAHEAGHFFTLLHTHHGWDDAPWDLTIGNPSPSIAPGLPGNVRTEKVDGSNCDEAGDRVCDTPPDYNGLSWQNCEYNSGARDPDSVLIDPDERNIMSYFQNDVGGCRPMVFSDQQKSLMRTDLASPRRAFLRNEAAGFIPIDIDGPPELVAPLDGGEAPGGTGRVRLDWDRADGATDYLVEIDRISSFSLQPIRLMVKGTEVEVENLDIGRRYFWRVRPWNEYRTCTDLTSEVQSFTVTDATTAVNDLAFLEEWTIAPNPVRRNSELYVRFRTARSFVGEVQLFNVTGQLVRQVGRTAFAPGANQVRVSTADLSSGIYLLSLVAEGGRLTQRVVVME